MEKLEHKVTIVTIIIGLIMMFLVPTWQIPDEYTHLKMVGTSLKNDKFAEILAEDVGIEGGRIMMHYEEKVDVQELKEAMVSMPKCEKDELMPNGISLSVIKHLPSTIGIFLGIVVGLPTYWVLQLGELFSLLFYASICFLAMKFMPIKKEMFAIIILMPMALQQAGGIGYDSVLMPLCFLMIAYLLHLKFKEEIRLRDVLCLLALWMLITYIKMPYCFLILLILTLPLEKFCFKIGKLYIDGKWFVKYWWIVGVIGLFAGVAVVYFLKDNFWIQLVIGLIKEWRRTLYLLIQTGKTWTSSLVISTVGNFGWLDTPVNDYVAMSMFLVLAAVAVINCDDNNKKRLGRWDVIVVCGTFGVLCLFTAFAMVNHTIMVTFYGSEFVNETYDIQTALYQISYIGGLQGRYFLPFISLFFLLFPQLRQIKGKKLWFSIAIFEIVIHVYVVHVLICRYWIT